MAQFRISHQQSYTINDYRANRSFGSNFKISSNGKLTRIGTWLNTITQNAQYYFAIWDNASQTKLRENSFNVPSSGWVDINITPLDLIAERVYTLLIMCSNPVSTQNAVGLSSVSTVTQEGVTLTMLKGVGGSASCAFSESTPGTPGTTAIPKNCQASNDFMVPNLTIELNEPPTTPVVKYNNTELSKIQGSPTDIPVKNPTFNISATDPDAGDTLQYKISVLQMNNTPVYDSGYGSSQDIQIPAGNLLGNTSYKIEAFAKDNNGAETQSDNYFIHVQSLFEVKLSEEVTVSDGDIIHPIGYKVFVNNKVCKIIDVDVKTKTYTFEIDEVGSDTITVEVDGKTGEVLDNLLFAIS